MKEDFLTSSKATNALSKMRTKECTLEELELTKDEIRELIEVTGNIKYNTSNKTYYITKFNEKNYEIISFASKEKVTEKWLELSDIYFGSTFCEEQIILTHTNNKPKLPEGFEFLPVKHSINIKKQKDNKKQYMDLLLEADPSEKMINKYLSEGELFVLTYNDELACIAVTIKKDDDTIELKNIATKENYRGKGYAKKMIKYLADNYKTRYNKMIVGTTENNIPFYVKQGFDKYEKTVKNFFIDNYEEEIKDGDLVCTDLIYYSKDLNKKCSY